MGILNMLGILKCFTTLFLVFNFFEESDGLVHSSQYGEVLNLTGSLYGALMQLSEVKLTVLAACSNDVIICNGIKVVDLSSANTGITGNIQKIGTDAFLVTPSVTHLYLNNNNGLTAIKINAFNGLNSLEFLDLSQNIALQTIASGNMDVVQNSLKSLNLSFSNNMDVSFLLNGNWGTLEELYCQFYTNTFTIPGNMISLKILALDESKLSILANSFANFNNLVMLSMYKLHSVNDWNLLVKNIPISVETLILGKNNLQTSFADMFVNRTDLVNLKTLDLSENKLNVLSVNRILGSLRCNLSVIDLSKQNPALNEFPNFASVANSINSISITENFIQSIHFHQFNYLKQLGYLNLEKSYFLKNIDDMSTLTNLKSISLTTTYPYSFNCTCGFKWINSSSISISKTLNLKPCATPPSMADMTWYNITFSEVCATLNGLETSTLETTFVPETTTLVETTTSETTFVPETTTLMETSTIETTYVPETSTLMETSTIDTTYVPETTTLMETTAKETTYVPETTTLLETTAIETTYVPETTALMEIATLATANIHETSALMDTTTIITTSVPETTVTVPTVNSETPTVIDTTAPFETTVVNSNSSALNKSNANNTASSETTVMKIPTIDTTLAYKRPTIEETSTKHNFTYAVYSTPASMLILNTSQHISTVDMSTPFVSEPITIDLQMFSISCKHFPVEIAFTNICNATSRCVCDATKPVKYMCSCLQSMIENCTTELSKKQYCQYIKNMEYCCNRFNSVSNVPKLTKIVKKTSQDLVNAAKKKTISPIVLKKLQVYYNTPVEAPGAVYVGTTHALFLCLELALIIISDLSQIARYKSYWRGAHLDKK